MFSNKLSVCVLKVSATPGRNMTKMNPSQYINLVATKNGQERDMDTNSLLEKLYYIFKLPKLFLMNAMRHR